MANYTYAQLQGLWIQAGGAPSKAPIMAAIALAESSGNPNAVGPVGEHGLWQIYGKAWPGMDTFDPLGNARSAVTVESKQGLTAWSTYSNGAYKAHMSGGTTPTTAGLPNGTGTTAAAGMAASAPTGDKTCLIGFSGFSIPVIGNVGSFCMLSKVQARDVIGGALLLSGGLMALIAVVTIIKSEPPSKVAGNLRDRAQARSAAAALPSPPVPQLPAAPVKSEKPDQAAEIAKMRARGNQLAPRTKPAGKMVSGSAGKAVSLTEAVGTVGAAAV